MGKVSYEDGVVSLIILDNMNPMVLAAEPSDCCI